MFSTSLSTAFSYAYLRASFEFSVAITVEPGRFFATASATHPLPAQSSSTRGAGFPDSLLMASSTRSSVSGLGISTPGPTFILRP